MNIIAFATLMRLEGGVDMELVINNPTNTMALKVVKGGVTQYHHVSDDEAEQLEKMINNKT